MPDIVTHQLPVEKSNVDTLTRRIGIGIFGLMFGLFISVVLLSLIGDWLIGRGLELIGAGLFAWFFINKSGASYIQPKQTEQVPLPDVPLLK